MAGEGREMAPELRMGRGFGEELIAKPVFIPRSIGEGADPRRIFSRVIFLALRK